MIFKPIWGTGISVKGTTRGLSGVFLPMVMNPLCPLKYIHGLMVCHGQYNTLLWEESFRWLRNAAGPLDVPLIKSHPNQTCNIHHFSPRITIAGK